MLYNSSITVANKHLLFNNKNDSTVPKTTKESDHSYSVCGKTQLSPTKLPRAGPIYRLADIFGRY